MGTQSHQVETVVETVVLVNDYTTENVPVVSSRLSTRIEAVFLNGDQMSEKKTVKDRRMKN
jgi:hypothetical protein